MGERTKQRLEWLRAQLEEHTVEAILLTKPANIAALFDGAEVSLGFRQEPPGRIGVCVTPREVTILGNRTEVARVLEDELGTDPEFHVEAFSWNVWELKGSVAGYLKSRGYQCVWDDIGVFGKNVNSSLEAMFYPLGPQEVAALRALASETALIVEATARRMRPGLTEAEIAGDLAGQLVAACIRPELIMIAADDRIERLRHCNPSDAPIRSVALVSATVHRRGLYVSVTRLVACQPVPEPLLRWQQACNRVDAAAIAASRPGTPVGDVFSTMLCAYADEGVPDEWTMHHQGGPAGFCGRDFKATAGETRTLVERQPIVWNPTIRGAKSEDTILTKTHDELPEVLTHTGNWTYHEVETGGGTLLRPSILVL